MANYTINLNQKDLDDYKNFLSDIQKQILNANLFKDFAKIQKELLNKTNELLNKRNKYIEDVFNKDKNAVVSLDDSAGKLISESMNIEKEIIKIKQNILDSKKYPY